MKAYTFNNNALLRTNDSTEEFIALYENSPGLDVILVIPEKYRNAYVKSARLHKELALMFVKSLGDEAFFVGFDIKQGTDAVIYLVNQGNFVAITPMTLVFNDDNEMVQAEINPHPEQAAIDAIIEQAISELEAHSTIH